MKAKNKSRVNVIVSWTNRIDDRPSPKALVQMFDRLEMLKEKCCV
jgi:hypothetical protein